MTCHCAYCKKQAARRQLTPAQQAQVAQATSLMVANAAARVVPPIETAPEPPNLVAAINARRSGAPVTVPEPVIFGGGPRPLTAAAAYETIDEPPSLLDAILRRRTQR